MLRTLRSLFKIYESMLRVDLLKCFILTFLLALLFGSLMYYVEVVNGAMQISALDCFYWAIVTMSTVGYGDISPATTMGKMFVAIPCITFGIGVKSIFLANITGYMMRFNSRRRRGLMSCANYKNHILICEYPGTGKVKQLVFELSRSEKYKDRKFVLIAAKLDEIPEDLEELDVSFLKGDPTQEETLIRAGVKNCEGVFVLAQDANDPASDARTFTIGTIIEMIEAEIGRSIKVVTEVVSKDNLKMMARSSVDSVVYTTGIINRLMVQEFMFPRLKDVIDQILTNDEGSQLFITDENLSLVGVKMKAAYLSAIEHALDLQVIGLIDLAAEVVLNPKKDRLLLEGERLIVLAESFADFTEFQNHLTVKFSAAG